MMTVGAMSRNAYLTFKLGQENSLFASLSSTQNLGFGLPAGGSFANTNNLLADALNKQSTAQKDTIGKLEEYSKTSDKFYADFFPKTDALKTSANALQNTDFSKAKPEDVVSSVQQFTKDYNSTLAFFSENAKVSNRVQDLATSFAAPKHNSKSLSAIGVNVDSSGKLSVDAAKLSSALTADSAQVNKLLGGNKGLAGQAYNKTSVAINNAADMVPFPKLSNNFSGGLAPGILLDMFA